MTTCSNCKENFYLISQNESLPKDIKLEWYCRECHCIYNQADVIERIENIKKILSLDPKL